MMNPRKLAAVLGDTIVLAGNFTHKVQPNATVDINGKPAKLADLKQNDMVSLDGNPAVAIVATRDAAK